MKHFIIISLFIAFTVVCTAQNTPTPTPTPETIIVCKECQNQDFNNITSALAYASAGDTILVEWEDPYDSVYTEYLDISIAAITLTSDGTGDNLPVIQADVNGGADEIIDVTADGVEISNLKIRNSDLYYDVVNPTFTPADETDMDSEVGIRITADGCKVYNCDVTRCRVGIYLNPDGTDWNIVENCRIGGIDDGSDPYWHVPFPLGAHPGNFFGIVHMAPDREAADTTPTPYTYRPDKIVNCTIQGNRFYGVVVRNGSQAVVTNNLIVWNGTGRDLELDGQYGDGGLLSLFTSDELTTGTGDEVDIQSPKIYSNTIFGNNGYQVCIVSENSAARDISNIPVIMNNNIGWVWAGISSRMCLK